MWGGFWQLAKYSGSGSYWGLLANTYNMTSSSRGPNDYGIHSAPLSFIRGGYYYYSNGSLSDRGERGSYWESKVADADNAWILWFGPTLLIPQLNGDKGNGYSIRCVVR